jgi:DNA adenine methylase
MGKTVRPTIEPFLKWPGGKRWLVEKYSNLFPRSCRRYIEPFLGGGAVFFFLQPRHAILTDVDADLINAYRQVRAHPQQIETQLRKLEKRHCHDFYYYMRDQEPESLADRAVRFIYLNRTCFNGLYRLNRDGRFNVPVGTKNQVSYPPGYLEMVAKALRAASLQVADFEQTMDRARDGDFLYVDPPYTVAAINGNFIRYNDRLFSWHDQRRLADTLCRAKRRGAMFLLSNANEKCIQDLYAGVGFRYEVERVSRLAADSAARTKKTELVISSYRA